MIINTVEAFMLIFNMPLTKNRSTDPVREFALQWCGRNHSGLESSGNNGQQLPVQSARCSTSMQIARNRNGVSACADGVIIILLTYAHHTPLLKSL